MRAAPSGVRRGLPRLAIQGWQCAGAPGHGPAGMALSDVPERERLGAVVPQPDRAGAQNAPNHDRSPRAQAADHVVDNVAQAASDFVLILSCEELRLRG